MQDTQSTAVVFGDLDVTVVEDGDAAAALKCSTDNGCDTVKGSDC